MGSDDVPARAVRHGSRWVRVAAGAALAVIGMVVLFGPFVHLGSVATLTVSESHGLCGTQLGQVAQAFSTRLSLDCEAVGAAWTIGWALVLGGALLALVGGLVRRSGA
jgi:uncharacterized membrane protein HdeD (DUF308 family)